MEYEQYGRRLELTNKYANGAGADWRKELADYASLLKSKGEIKPELPEKVAPVKHKEVKMKGWPLSADDIQKMLSKEKSLRKEIEVADGVKIAFVRVPAGKFVMGTNDGYPDQAPEFKAEVKKGFWMSEKELTNEQYNALVLDHDSRIYAQFWKDHTTPGYPANKPNQPVIRVSYEEAVNYCRMLSEKTGLNVQLPTEVQWNGLAVVVATSLSGMVLWTQTSDRMRTWPMYSWKRWPLQVSIPNRWRRIIPGSRIITICRRLKRSTTV